MEVAEKFLKWYLFRMQTKMKISGDSNLHKSENQALHSSIYGQTKQQQAFTTRDYTHVEFQAHQLKTLMFRPETNTRFMFHFMSSWMLLF